MAKPMRRWLNDDPVSRSYTIVETVGAGFGEHGGATLEIADCSRHIVLEFIIYARDKKTFEKNRAKLQKKLNILYDALNRVSLALDEAEYKEKEKND